MPQWPTVWLGLTLWLLARQGNRVTAGANRGERVLRLDHRLGAMLLLAGLAGLAGHPAAGETNENMPSNNEVLVEFTLPDEGKWQAVNDGVMGGVSRSQLRVSDQATGVFTGELSLANNGGFASVRAVVGPWDLSGCDGLEIRVKGDGRTYQLRLRTDSRFDGVAYAASFPTRNGEWTTIALPFAGFRPTFRGRVLNDQPPLATGNIAQLAFMLADKQAGPFRLEIETIKTWHDPEGKPR